LRLDRGRRSVLARFCRSYLRVLWFVFYFFCAERVLWRGLCVVFSFYRRALGSDVVRRLLDACISFPVIKEARLRQPSAVCRLFTFISMCSRSDEAVLPPLLCNAFAITVLSAVVPSSVRHRFSCRPSLPRHSGRASVSSLHQLAMLPLPKASTRSSATTALWARIAAPGSIGPPFCPFPGSGFVRSWSGCRLPCEVLVRCSGSRSSS